MVNTSRPSVCIIGSGNVATHLALALQHVADIVQIYSHTLSNAMQLADKLHHRPHATDDLNRIVQDAYFYIVSVKDDFIEEVAENTPSTTGIWAHTSGSVPMTVFEPYKKRYGVFYPLQTFSKQANVEFSNVPLFIEGSDNETTSELKDLASQISSTVAPADSRRRQALHIAAVFACNFVNYMWSMADELLRDENLDISYLQPLLQETLRKLSECSPREAMTGPARRGDLNIINKHIGQLDSRKAALYEFITHEILKDYGYEQD
ncbi:MAG: DUF2520 domain-containing protein [Muribaculaceae bacterium]|nr:DUF2520 domain-containing protein [Muribaculaceae bacterium]